MKAAATACTWVLSAGRRPPVVRGDERDRPGGQFGRHGGLQSRISRRLLRHRRVAVGLHDIALRPDHWHCDRQPNRGGQPEHQRRRESHASEPTARFPADRPLAEVLRTVVDDADQPGAGCHRWIPVGIHDAGQLVARHAGDVLEAELVHGVVVAGQQDGRGPHLCHLFGAMAVAGVVARQVQPEPVHPAVAEPHLLHPGHIGQLNVLDPGAVPDQPGNAVGVRGGAVVGDLIGETIGQLVDVFDQPSEGVAK